MVSFAKLFPPMLLTFLIPTTRAIATYKHSTHRTHYVGASRSLKLEVFHPESIFHAFGIDGVDPLPEDRRYARSIIDTGEAAVSFLASKLRVSEDTIHFRNSARGQITNHTFLAQKINGVPVANAVANIAFNDNGKVSSFSSSFVEHSGAADIHPSVTLGDAIATAETMLDGAYHGHPTKLEFFVEPDGFAALTHVIQIRNETVGTWYEAFVDAHSNTLLSVTDFVRKSSYLVVPFQTTDPTVGGFSNVTDPQLLTASPNGWHQEFDNATNQTDGNNAFAFNGTQLSDPAVVTSPGLNFGYVADLKQDPSVETNVQAAIVNAFYVINKFHDFAYLYGFTEATFNHQTNNFNNSGQGFDRVLVSVQDHRGSNGADFAILPDGQSCEMQLYLFNNLNPKVDSAFQNDILIHECQHGANNRMTGGGNATCYQTNEAGALDEGYSDAMADALTQEETTADFVFGKDLSTSPSGLRSYPYSTSATTNPLRYSSLNGMTDLHAMGEVWANMLHIVYAALVSAFGWTKDSTVDPTLPQGNVVFFHLVFDALLLQPCNPTFVQARDALIQADANRNKGNNRCLLWTAFASRGLGAAASGNFADDTSVPSGC